MLDKLKELFSENLAYPHVAGILQQLANLVNIVSNQYMKDPQGRNIAIDTICDILQSHKDAPVEKTISEGSDASK